MRGQVATGTTAFAERKIARPFATCRKLMYEPVGALISVVGVSQIPKHDDGGLPSGLVSAIGRSAGMSKAFLYEAPRKDKTLEIIMDSGRFACPHIQQSTDCSHRFTLNKDLRVDVMEYLGIGLTSGVVTGLMIDLLYVQHTQLQSQTDPGLLIVGSMVIGAVAGGIFGNWIGRRKETRVNARVHVNEMIRTAALLDWKPILCVYTKGMADAVVNELLARGAVMADENMEARAMEAARPQAAVASG